VKEAHEINLISRVNSLKMDESPSDKNSLFPEADIRFASFGSRLGASLLDGLINVAIILPITYYNILTWKIPYLFVITSLAQIAYKPFLEYRYGATLGKMAVGIEVLGHQFQRVSLNEEMKRVSFYIVPSFIQFILTVRIYFSPEFVSAKNYTQFNQLLVDSNPATLILSGLVVMIGIADCITFFLNNQGRSLHDLYADTYVVEKMGR
jgi:uncharacterized RDD family membrane protein YckC